MKRICLLSDTHSYYDPDWEKYFDTCDEIWHAGDFGTPSVMDRLSEHKPVKGVFGNIDGSELRRMVPEIQVLETEGVKVLMIHIGGFPGKYPTRVRNLIEIHRPTLFICGHSHILRIIYDKQYQMLTMNPGAAGKSGFHKVRTLVRFTLTTGRITNAEIIELGVK